MLGHDTHTVSIDQIEREAMALRAKRDSLRGRLQSTEQEIARLAAKRLGAVTGDDDHQLDQINGQIARSHEAADGLQSALAVMDGKLQEMEAAQAVEHDRIARQRFSDWVSSKIGEIERAAGAFRDAAVKLAVALQSSCQSGAGVAASLGQFRAGLDT